MGTEETKTPQPQPQPQPSPKPAPKQDIKGAAKPGLKSREGDRVYVWPDLVFIELVALMICTFVFILLSFYLNAPLEEPANPAHTPNPSRAPWYFLGLQEMLVYFDPWFAGVLLPTLIIVGLMAIPYIDSNSRGVGGYFYKERRFAFAVFTFGFGLWFLLIIFGVFFRGPNWDWYRPGEDRYNSWIKLTPQGLKEAVGTYEKDLSKIMDKDDVKKCVDAAWALRDDLKVKGPSQVLKKNINRALIKFDEVISVVDTSVPEKDKITFYGANRELKDRFSGQPKLHNMHPLAGAAFLIGLFLAVYLPAFFINYPFCRQLGAMRYNVTMLLMYFMALTVAKMFVRLLFKVKYILYWEPLSKFNLRI